MPENLGSNGEHSFPKNTKRVAFPIMTNVITLEFYTFYLRPVETEKTSQRKAFVNSPVLSLTTQTNIGPLNPPLNLTFKNVQTVR